jgi:hypothetical protein
LAAGGDGHKAKDGDQDAGRNANDGDKAKGGGDKQGNAKGGGDKHKANKHRDRSRRKD